MRGRAGRIRFVAGIAVLAVLVPGIGEAGTQKPPYLFAFSFKQCMPAATGMKCTGAINADAKTGALTTDLAAAAALVPSRGMALGLAVVAGAAYNLKARRSVPITVVVKLNSAQASTPTPVSAGATGSFSILQMYGGGNLLGCERCIGTTQRTIVASGAMQTAPPSIIIPPKVPGMPKLPPATPTAPALPGTAPSGIVTLKFNITNGRRLVPVGTVFLGAVIVVVDTLGGAATPTPEFMGPRQPMNDVGSSKITANLTVVSMTVN